jgi:hypothetical protein
VKNFLPVADGSTPGSSAAAEEQSMRVRLKTYLAGSEQPDHQKGLRSEQGRERLSKETERV